MEILIKIAVCFIAGAGAGIGTGFAGMSAAAVIGPMLITFLNIPAYQAVAVGLASDVLASAVSAYTYYKNKNLDIKNGFVMMVCVLLFTVIGSFVASRLPNSTMGNFSVIMTMLLGFRFLFRPVTATRESMNSESSSSRIAKAVAGGCGIGFICGFVGAGGGMMMLLVLTSFLGYELKTAVGTSVFVMAFTAFTGAFSHFKIGGLPDIQVVALCILFTFIWARIAAKIANKADTKTLNRVVGVVLILLGVVVLSANLFFK